MFDSNEGITLKIGSSTDLLSEYTLSHRQHVIYLTNPPYDNRMPFLDSFTILYFLSSFDDFNYQFTPSKKSIKTINGETFTHYINILTNQKKLFKVRYQLSGNLFVIQIINTDQSICYNKKEIKFNKKIRTVYIYSKKPRFILLSTSPIQIVPNKGIQELSIFYNNKKVDRNIQNPMTSFLFYNASPFHPKTIKRNANLQLNPDDTIEGILKNFGGHLFKFIPAVPLDNAEYPLGVFTWFSPFFEGIVESDQFDLSTTIELDATFKALEPYAICIPQLIFRNTGIPLGLMVAPSESTSLYSMFFEALKKLDAETGNSYYPKFVEKKFLTDEHKAFIKLSKIYNLEIFHCFVHIIRTIGSNSLLGFLVSDILYTFSEEEWNKNLLRFWHTLKYLSNLKEPYDSTRFNKVSQILGLDMDGNPIPTNPAYSPIYLRIQKNVPTTTNHIEAFHKHLNSIIHDSRTNIYCRLAYTCKYICDRTLKVNKSAKDNLKTYLQKIEESAKEVVTRNPKLIGNYSKDICACHKKGYFCSLFWNMVPCIHEILSKDYDQSVYLINCENFDFNFNDLKKTDFNVYELETDLKFKKKQKTDNSIGTLNLDIISKEDYFDDDILTRIVKHTEYQMKKIINDNNLNFTVIALKLQSDLLNDDKFRSMLSEDENQFWAYFQVRLWQSILEGNNEIDV